MRQEIAAAALGALMSALAAAQDAPPPATPPAPVETPVPSAPGSAPAGAAPAIAIPAPAPILRLSDPPVIAVESLPAENPFATPADAAALAPVKPVTADAVVPTTLFAAVLVDPKGKVLNVRRARDPIPSLGGQTQGSIIRWTFDPARKAGQPVQTWGAVRLDLSAEVDSPRIEQFLLTPITATTPIPQPLSWGADAAWLEGLKPAPVEGVMPVEQVDTPPVPKKQPWSSSSYKGPFSIKFWVRINPAGHVEKAIPIAASDPLLIAYFRKAMDGWLFRPARTGQSAVATWNELTLAGQISYSTDLKSSATLRQSL
ncbi:MAG TPA: hypothetical protein VIA45_13470 [Thermoanaerobaculia bacterium]|jgi:hypothetical protein